MDGNKKVWLHFVRVFVRGVFVVYRCCCPCITSYMCLIWIAANLLFDILTFIIKITFFVRLLLLMAPYMCVTIQCVCYFFPFPWLWIWIVASGFCAVYFIYTHIIVSGHIIAVWDIFIYSIAFLCCYNPSLIVHVAISFFY